jgi:hypothetical protein
MTVAEAVDGLPHRLASWAAARSLAPNSLTGVSLALGLCAAVWFSAGTLPGSATGALALCGSYLAGRSARGLTGRSPDRAGSGVTAETASRGNAAWRTMRAKAVSDARLARACAAITECGAYAGLAAGGQVGIGIVAGGLAGSGPAAGWTSMWQLATAAMILVAVSQLAGTCCSTVPSGASTVPSGASRVPSGAGPVSPGASPVPSGAGLTSPGRKPAWPGSLREAPPYRRTSRALALPYGGRILLVALVAPVLGARGVFFGLVGWAVIAICYAIAGSLSQPAETRAARAIVACRDDGLIAIEAGLLTRGQLVPLPPALTGVAAVSVLAVLGLRNLPGPLLLAPVVAMLLAAVGSSHPHDGRLDRLVPAMLQAGQYLYIAAIGFASGVPAPLIFALCALITLRYADLPGHPPSGKAMGWEGRMITVGLGAALGMATVAYLLLAAYVGVLSCREIMRSWLAVTEGDRW